MSRFSSRVLLVSATVAMATAMATVLLAGCGGAQSGKSSSAAGAAVFGAANGGDAAVPPPAAASSAAAGTGAVGTSAIPASGADVVLKSTALIETADLTVQTPQVTEMATQATTIAATAGGSVTAEVVTDATGGTSSNRTPASADVTLAVPPASLQSVLTQLDRLGTEQSRHTSTQDVTGQVADVTSRVTSAQASIARLQVLFEQAQKVSDIVDIENELAQREADLESLQAQQRALSAQTSNAVITLHLVSTPVTTVTHHGSARGFGAGLSHGWHAFGASVAWVLTAVGAALPFLVMLAVVLAAFLIIRRRHGSAARPVIPAASGPGVSE